MADNHVKKNSIASNQLFFLSINETPLKNFLNANPFQEIKSHPQAVLLVKSLSTVRHHFRSSLSSCGHFFEKVSSELSVKQNRPQRLSLHLCMASINKTDEVISRSTDSTDLKRRNVKSEEEINQAKSKPVKSVEKSQEKNLLKIIFDGMIAGACAGVTVETMLYPIDTIKTRLQVARRGGGINFNGLYSGLSGNLIGVLPASAIFIGVYEPMKQKLLSFFPQNLSAFAHLSAGAFGGLAASLVRVPTEVIKQRMQLREFTSAASAIKTITTKEGIKGLFAGYSSFLLRDLPFDALQFMIYEQLKITGKKMLKRDLHDTEMAFMGAISGAATGALTTPLDVIKTRLMTQGASGQYVGIRDCVSKIFAEEGASAFLQGIGPRVLWIGIGGSIFFGVLEKSKQIISSFEAKSSLSTNES